MMFRRAKFIGILCFVILLMACGKPLPDVVLITLDTTRYDALHPRVTPNLWGFRDQSTWFSHGLSVAPITLPSHTSILTGLYPNRHGVRDNGIYVLAQKVKTLAEALREKGYTTYAFVSSFILHHRYGLHQGFMRYNDRFIHPKRRWQHLPMDRRAEETIDLAIQALRTPLKEPFFLWVHLYDPHADYDPPPPFNTYPHPYLGEVAYMDAHLGRLLTFLEKSRLATRSWIIITADHGESLGVHGEPTHGFLLHPPTLHVPLLVHRPGQQSKAIIDYPVSLVDIFPTLQKDLLLSVPYPLDGENLFHPRMRLLFSETFIPLSFNWSALFRVEKKGKAQISYPSSHAYDLAQDPWQDHPLPPDPPLIASLKGYQKVKPIGGRNRKPIDPETQGMLRSLGYLTEGGEGEVVGKALPNPEEKMGILKSYQQVIHALEDGDTKTAKEKIQAILKEERTNPRFHLLEAQIYAQEGNYPRAEQAATLAVQCEPEDPRNIFMVGYYQEKQNHMEKAKRSYQKALSLNPDHFLSRYNLARLLILEKNYPQAWEMLEALVKEAPDSPAVWNNLAYLAKNWKKDCPQALRYLQKAYHLAHQAPFYAFSLGSLLCRCEKPQEGLKLLQGVKPTQLPPGYRQTYQKELTQCQE